MSRYYGKKPEVVPEPVTPVSEKIPAAVDIVIPEDLPLESEEIFPDEENDS